MKSVKDAIKAALVAINGTGSYTYNLSASGVVRYGRPTQEGGVRCPSCWLWYEGGDDEQIELVGQVRRARYAIQAAVQTTTAGMEAAGDAAMDLIADIRRALFTDPTLGGLVTTAHATDATLDGDEAGIPGGAVAVMVVEVEWLADMGEFG